MSYQVIARKWRPQSFDDVCGQDHVTTPLRNAIRTDRIPHAVLLTGPRGTGKTTLARILARCLNCEKGPTDTPCGECPSCREIAGGTSTDVQEIDAASRTSVDDMRQLVEAIRYAPSPGKYKIFVVDEVHMLSTAAFNALLKTLEEPPPRSLFVFATTNPEKIPFTVVSRCQRFDLRRISAAEIVERLSLIARAEGIEISERSLLAVAREGDGSMRDAQTLLDQIIAFGGGSISDELVAKVLDLVDRRQLLAILTACCDGDAKAALSACCLAGQGGLEAKRLGESLLGLLRDLVVLRISPEASGLVEGSDEEIAELREIAERTEVARLRRMFRALLKEQEDLAWAPQPMAVLEMAVVRLATLPAGDDVQRLLSRIDNLEKRLSAGGAGPAPSGGNAGGGGGQRPARSAGNADSQPSEAPRRRRSQPDPGPPPQLHAPEDAAPPPGEPSNGPPIPMQPDAPLPVVFDRLKAFVRRENPGLSGALDGGRLLACEPGSLHIAVPLSFAARRLEDKRELFEALCSQLFGRPTQMRVEADDTAISAEATNQRDDPELLRQMRQNALNHPGVNAALEILEGEIVEIRPIAASTAPGAASRQEAP